MNYIQLTRGYRALIDDVDAHLSELKWSALVTKTGLVYAQRKARNREMIFGQPRQTYLLHRTILGVEDRTLKVDHINGDTLDNRRENLRVCNHTDNMRNAGLRKTNTTGHAGVQWCERIKRFQVFMTINRKNTYFGSFANLDEAIAKRRELETEHWGGYYPRRVA